MTFFPILSSKQQALIYALSKFGTIEAACKQVGVSKTTYYRWLNNYDFVKELESTRKFVYNASITRINRLIDKVLDSYERVLDEEDVATKFKGARDVVKNIGKLIYLQEVSDKNKEKLELQTLKQKKDTLNIHPDEKQQN